MLFRNMAEASFEICAGVWGLTIRTACLVGSLLRPDCVWHSSSYVARCRGLAYRSAGHAWRTANAHTACDQAEGIGVHRWLMVGGGAFVKS